MTERASIFGDELDISDFTPKPRKATDKAAIREVAERRGFASREPAAEPERAGATPARNTQRRHRTGRDRQLNIKATPETIERFSALADSQGWVMGEALEKAVAALEREISRT